MSYITQVTKRGKKKTRDFSASFSSLINPTPPLLRKITNNTKNRSLKNDEKKKKRPPKKENINSNPTMAKNRVKEREGKYGNECVEVLMLMAVSCKGR